MITAAELLSRIENAAPGGAVDRLSALLIDEALERPVAELLPPSFLAGALRESLQSFLASPEAEPALRAALDGALKGLSNDRRPLREALPQDLGETLIELLSRPYTPDRQVVAALLEPEPVRKAIRSFVLQVVTDFGQRLRAPVADSRVARGIGGLARFAAEHAKSRSGAFGAFAGAVSEEVERQVERKASEFVDSALSGILSRLADDLSNTANARGQAALRAAFLEGALELPVRDLAHGLERADLPGGAKIIREALGRFLARPDAQAQLEALFVQAQKKDGARKVREVLLELGLLEPSRKLGQEALRGWLAAFFRSPAFAAWLGALTGV